MSKVSIPDSVTIENICKVKESLMKTIQGNDSIELDFSNIEKIDITGLQMFISTVLLCEREKKEINCTGFSDTFMSCITKNGFENEKTISKFFKGEQYG